MKYKFRKLLSAMCVCALITSVVPISGAAANQSGAYAAQKVQLDRR